MISLDNEILCGRLPIPEIIKIDVEGAELQVLYGAQKLLTTHMPILLVAIHGTSLLSSVTEFLQSLGFNVQADPSNDPGFYELFALPHAGQDSPFAKEIS